MSTSSNPFSSGSGGEGPAFFTYKAPFHIFAVNWSIRNDKSFRLAISSVYEEEEEQVQILRIHPSGEIRPDPYLSFHHPSTCANTLSFIPDPECHHPDLLASAADDTLRLWQISDGVGVALNSQLSNSGGDAAATLTSLDWNPAVPRRIAASCVNHMCTVWNWETEAVEFQLSDHGGEVNDVAWGGDDVFASASSDGTIRVTDMRNWGKSQVLHEAAGKHFFWIEWSYHVPNYIAAAAKGSSEVALLDPRRPGPPAAELRGHVADVKAITWAPCSRHVCTAGEDAHALIWEIPAAAEGGVTPFLDYAAGGGILQAEWSRLQPDWIAIAFDETLQLLHV